MTFSFSETWSWKFNFFSRMYQGTNLNYMYLVVLFYGCNGVNHRNVFSVSGFRWEDHLCKAQNTVVRNWEIGGCFIESRFVPQENQPSKRNRVHHNLSWRHNVFRGQLHVNSGVVIVFNSLTCFISFLAYISFWFLSLLHRITKR